MQIFNDWLQQYDAKKEELPDFKKASQSLVQLCLDAVESKGIVPEDEELFSSDQFQQGMTWARTYVNMPKGKRLANTLTSEDPQAPDMDSLRLLTLHCLVPDGGDKLQDKLWRYTAGKDKQLSDLHLQLLLWAYTPAAKQVTAMLK